MNDRMAICFVNNITEGTTKHEQVLENVKLIHKHNNPPRLGSFGCLWTQKNLNETGERRRGRMAESTRHTVNEHGDEQTIKSDLVCTPDMHHDQMRSS